jgi:hypothetical protein
MLNECAAPWLTASFGAIVYTLWFAPTVLDAQQVANPTAAALAEFAEHATAYMDLHKKQEAAALDIKAGASPAEVLAFEKVLAERIKAPARRQNRARYSPRTWCRCSSRSLPMEY